MQEQPILARIVAISFVIASVIGAIEVGHFSPVILGLLAGFYFLRWFG